MEDRVCSGQLFQPLFREQLAYHGPERLVHAVIVVGVEKAARLEVPAQGAQFFRGESDRPVARHVQERISP